MLEAILALMVAGNLAVLAIGLWGMWHWGHFR